MRGVRGLLGLTFSTKDGLPAQPFRTDDWKENAGVAAAPMASPEIASSATVSAKQTIANQTSGTSRSLKYRCRLSSREIQASGRCRTDDRHLRAESTRRIKNISRYCLFFRWKLGRRYDDAISSAMRILGRARYDRYGCGYRVRSRQQTTPAECVKDGKSAVRWIRRERHATWGSMHIASRLAGGSAGGHVAAAVAATTGFIEEGEDTTISSMPDALVLYNPVFDNGPGGFGHQAVKDIFPAISPLHNLKLAHRQLSSS